MPERGVVLPVSMAMVALGDDGGLSADAIQRDLEKTWPDLPRANQTEEKDDTIAFSIGEQGVVLGLMPAPIPWSDLEGPCATSWLWQGAAGVLKQHTRHVIVTVNSDSSPIERAKLLTQVTASVLATCSSALGVLWADAALLIPKPIFRDFA